MKQNIRISEIDNDVTGINLMPTGDSKLLVTFIENEKNVVSSLTLDILSTKISTDIIKSNNIFTLNETDLENISDINDISDDINTCQNISILTCFDTVLSNYPQYNKEYFTITSVIENNLNIANIYDLDYEITNMIQYLNNFLVVLNNLCCILSINISSINNIFQEDNFNNNFNTLCATVCDISANLYQQFLDDSEISSNIDMYNLTEYDKRIFGNRNDIIAKTQNYFFKNYNFYEITNNCNKLCNLIADIGSNNTLGEYIKYIYTNNNYIELLFSNIQGNIPIQQLTAEEIFKNNGIYEISVQLNFIEPDNPYKIQELNFDICSSDSTVIFSYDNNVETMESIMSTIIYPYFNNNNLIISIQNNLLSIDNLSVKNLSYDIQLVKIY